MSSPSKAQVEQLILGLQQTDPRLYEALRAMNQELTFLYNEIFPVQLAVRRILAPPPLPDVVETFSVTVGPDFIVLNWSDTTGARFYELRRGTSWDTATFITKTPTLSATLDPLTAGSHTFLIKSINSGGLYQEGDPTSITATVSVPGTPAVTGQVVDNNVLLFWTTPAITSFRIREFRIYKDGNLVGVNTGTFIAFFELLSGTYEYEVSAVDIAGNEGATVLISLFVDQPPDFELQFDYTSIFDGTRVNAFLSEHGLLVCLDLTQTWEEHFDDNTWSTIQDQISAGYPIYCQPGIVSNTASYQEELDLGAITSNIIFNVLVGYTQIAGSTLIACQIDYKDAVPDAWTSAAAGFSAFIPSARYFRVTLDFTAADIDAILLVSSIRFIADVKQEIDSGQVDALAADGGGTTVTFNKDFLDVKSITATAGDTVAYTVVVDFTDVPNPTDFKVLAFDDTGARVDALVYWKARGIV